MNIKERYEKLVSSTNNTSTIDEIKQLKIDCSKAMNYEYFYYCDLLLADLYTDNGNIDDALAISLKDLNSIDSSVFRSIYVSFLDRIIYIYISKKNFKTAYCYMNMKKDHLDLNNKQEVNRWYLESAYVYAELNSISKALQSLEAIVNNDADDAMLSLVYSNMTKLYIDQENVEKAKESLNLCLKYVY